VSRPCLSLPTASPSAPPSITIDEALDCGVAGQLVHRRDQGDQRIRSAAVRLPHSLFQAPHIRAARFRSAALKAARWFIIRCEPLGFGGGVHALVELWRFRGFHSTSICTPSPSASTPRAHRQRANSSRHLQLEACCRQHDTGGFNMHVVGHGFWPSISYIRFFASFFHPPVPLLLSGRHAGGGGRPA